jgi:hypothetical protein
LPLSRAFWYLFARSNLTYSSKLPAARCPWLTAGRLRPSCDNCISGIWIFSYNPPLPSHFFQTEVVRIRKICSRTGRKIPEKTHRL